MFRAVPSPSEQAPATGGPTQLSLDLPEPEPFGPAYSVDWRINDLYENAPERDKPYIRLALDLLTHTCEDIKQGLELLRDSVKSGKQLSYRRDGLVLNYFLNAIDWLNEADEGGVNFPETAAQLQYSPRTIRRLVAGFFGLDTSDDVRHMVRLPPEFFTAVAAMEKPARRAKTARFVKPPALKKGDRPKYGEQPTLWHVWPNVVNRGCKS